MARAALIGTTVGYTDYYNCMVLETNDGRIISVSKRTFDYLYYKLDSFTAALKDDCIEYEPNDPMIPDSERPAWYIDAELNGDIYDMCGALMFRVNYDTGDAIEMNMRSVVLRNYLGDLRYMEWEDFIKYYDVAGSEFDE